MLQAQSKCECWWHKFKRWQPKQIQTATRTRPQLGNQLTQRATVVSTLCNSPSSALWSDWTARWQRRRRRRRRQMQMQMKVTYIKWRQYDLTMCFRVLGIWRSEEEVRMQRNWSRRTMGAQWTLLNGATLSFHINAYAEKEWARRERGTWSSQLLGCSSDSHFNPIRVSVWPAWVPPAMWDGRARNFYVLKLCFPKNYLHFEYTHTHIYIPYTNI